MRQKFALALGIAGTQAAGLKSMFGTMCKPLHAGKAPYHGLLAAKLAARGFTSRADVLECAQGFARTHSPDFHPERALETPPTGWHIRNNLFKYHAACYMTHAPIEAARKLREQHGVTPEQVERIRLRIDEASDRICNIPAPRTGLEAKFSLAPDHGDGAGRASIPGGCPPIPRRSPPIRRWSRCATRSNSISAATCRTRWPNWNCC